MAVSFIGTTDTDGFVATGSGDLIIQRAGATLTNVNGGDAFDFAALSGVRLYVGGLIASEDGDAISSTAGSSALQVVVEETGAVLSRSDAIELNGDDHSVVNNGELSALEDAAIQVLGDDADVTNFGTATGFRNPRGAVVVH